MPFHKAQKKDDSQDSPNHVDAGIVVEQGWSSLLELWRSTEGFYDLRDLKRLKFFLFYLNLKQQMFYLGQFTNLLFHGHDRSPIPLIEAAMRRSELRQLYPFTSLNALCFSRTTDYPYTRDCPCAVPQLGGKYRVYAPHSREIIGEGTLDEAIEMLVEHLPPNCGPAVNGTANDFVNS